MDSSDILLIRISGQVCVPYGKTSEYKSAYDAVTKGVGEDEVSDYFKEESSNKPYEVNYRDIYLVLDENKEQIGTCEIKWNRYQEFENGKTLSDLLKDFAPDIIRKTVPDEYKIKKYDSELKNKYDVLDYYLSDGKVQRCIGTPKGSLRVNTDKKIKRSAIYCDKWDSESNWTYSEMELSPFSGGNMNAGVALAVYRSDGEYYYKGTSKNPSSMNF